MAEYTYKDIIIDPEDPRLEGAIGKECYFYDYPQRLLEIARKNELNQLHRLKTIHKESTYHFVGDDCESGWVCIIIKKEEPKEYVPFENGEEFLDAYYNNETKNLDGIYHYLTTRGMWLKYKEFGGAFHVVTEIWRDGVVLGSDQTTTIWDDLLCDYTFLDGTPCGNKARVNNE